MVGGVAGRDQQHAVGALKRAGALLNYDSPANYAALTMEESAMSPIRCSLMLLLEHRFPRKRSEGMTDGDFLDDASRHGQCRPG